MKHAFLALVALALTATVAQADSLNCRLVGSCDTPGSADGVAVAGNYAYVADMLSGLRIIDVTNPQSPIGGRGTTIRRARPWAWRCRGTTPTWRTMRPVCA